MDREGVSMWNLTKQAKEHFQSIHILPFIESDDEWACVVAEAKSEGVDLQKQLIGELEEVKPELLTTLPKQFIPFVEAGTLNQPTLPKTIREDYLNWVREETSKFEDILDAAQKETQHAMTSLPPSVQEIFHYSLHDSRIDRLDREGDNLHLWINTDGGFTPHSYILLTFQDIVDEEIDVALQEGHWFIYYELQRQNEHYAFRVLFESPDSEWTITMKQLKGEYYFHPKEYTLLKDEGNLSKTSLQDLLVRLNRDYSYWFITPDFIHSINLIEGGKIVGLDIQVKEGQFIVTIGSTSYTYSLSDYHPIQFIHTNVYEDPYANQNEPLSFAEVEDAVLSDDLELQARAWNTMYTFPLELKDIINSVLGNVVQTEENGMLLSVYVNHFYREGILTSDNIERFYSTLEPNSEDGYQG